MLQFYWSFPFLMQLAAVSPYNLGAFDSESHKVLDVFSRIFNSDGAVSICCCSSTGCSLLTENIWFDVFVRANAT